MQKQAELRGAKKAYLFRKQMQKLPAEVVSLFEGSKVSRADKTKLVNGMVARQPDGNLMLDLEAPVLSMLQSHYTDFQAPTRPKDIQRV